MRLDSNDSIGDVMAHPSFGGFARQLLPWHDRPFNPAMKLGDIGGLLPYHSNVHPISVVSGLNRMVADAESGKTIFYNIYSDAETREQPAKAHTGLFFIRGKPGAPFALIAPGGGFVYVGSVHEGFPYGEDISRLGYNAFVLRYRAGHGMEVATEDLAAAVSYIFRNADGLKVDTKDYALWGSSAGARMAAYIGSHGPAAFGGANLPKPSAVVMAYTAHSDYGPQEPPTFAVVGEHDGISPVSAMQKRVTDLRQMGTEVEFRIFKGLGHGFGPGTGTIADGWITDAVRFWEKHMDKGSLQQ